MLRPWAKTRAQGRDDASPMEMEMDTPLIESTEGVKGEAGIARRMWQRYLSVLEVRAGRVTISAWDPPLQVDLC
jgi:hypothetical protein